MTDDNVIPVGDKFVLRRVAEKPVTYTVELTHMSIDGEWVLGVKLLDVDKDMENRQRIAADLRQAADMLENPDYFTVDING